MPPKEICQSCRCLMADYCYGAYFNHNPEEKDCPYYEPTTLDNDFHGIVIVWKDIDKMGLEDEVL